MIPHRQVLLKQIMLHCHTISYHCASIIADCSNTGQRKNNIFYLLSSLQRPIFVATSTSPQHILDHDRSIAARWIVKTVGEVILTLLWFGSRVERCSGGQRRGSQRGRAAAEASAAGAVALRRRPARPARPARTHCLPIRRPQPAAPSAKGRGAKPKA